MTYKELYKLNFKDEHRAEITLCDEKHPIFKAHFPTRPILPGFMHFEIVADVFKLDVTSIKKAKFSKVITPLQTLIYEKNGTKFKVFCQDEEVASFSL